MELKDFIRNAVKVALRDGYNQLVVEDKNGDYSIKRAYPNCLYTWLHEKVVAEIVAYWELGTAKAKVIML